MALSYKARRRWSIFLLLVWLPLYIVIAVTILAFMPTPPKWLELVIYILLGILWALPFKSVFKGIGREDPDGDQDR